MHSIDLFNVSFKVVDPLQYDGYVWMHGNLYKYIPLRIDPILYLRFVSVQYVKYYFKYCLLVKTNNFFDTFFIGKNLTIKYIIHICYSFTASLKIK